MRLQTLWRSAMDYLRPPPIGDVADLKTFLDRYAAHLGQYSTHEFSRNTLGYFGQEAWRHPVFKERMTICRWEAFAAVLSDLTILAEGRLRKHAPEPARLAQPLIDVYAQILGKYPDPAHRTDGWQPDIDQFRVRMAQAQMKPPSSANDVARVAARRIFDVLPVYSGNAEVDYMTIENALRFGAIGVGVQLDTRLDAPAVARELAGAA